jgi:hypothetical protein
MRCDPPAKRAREEHHIKVKVAKRAECWEILAALVARRAPEINRWRAGMPDDGAGAWQLAQSQTQQPLSCGILKQDHGRLITLDSSHLRTSEIEFCAEPRRLILLGRYKATDKADKRDPVVRVLMLPDEVEPSSLRIMQQGPIVHIELRKAVAGKQDLAPMKAA